MPETGRRGRTVGAVVVGAGREVVEAAVEVEEAGATVPVPTVPESAVQLPHDARRTLAAPTLRPVQFVTAQVWTGQSLRRGEVVLFQSSSDKNCGGLSRPAYLLHRVVGLPGDVVALSSGYVHIKGRRLNETWLPNSEQGVTRAGPDGHASTSLLHTRSLLGCTSTWGDNRTDSCESAFGNRFQPYLESSRVDLQHASPARRTGIPSQ
jgi:hypothetical protein